MEVSIYNVTPWKTPFRPMVFRKLSKCNKAIVTDIYMQLSIKVEKEGIMILEKILKLAEKNNISISCLEKTLGFGNGTIKKWGGIVSKCG